MDRARPGKPRCFIRQRSYQRRGCRTRRHCLAMVKRSDRRSDHQAQARETADVRSSQDRSSSGSAYRCDLIPATPKLRQSPYSMPKHKHMPTTSPLASPERVYDAPFEQSRSVPLAFSVPPNEGPLAMSLGVVNLKLVWACLLYTSDAADDLLCVDLGGRRI